MSTRDVLHRGFNLLAVSITALAGFAFMAEILAETEWAYKLDDIGLLVLGLIAIGWYLSKNNRFRLSVAPVVLIVLALLVKIGAIIVEISDAEDVGDDFGGVMLFLFGTGLVLYQYYKTKKLSQSL